MPTDGLSKRQANYISLLFAILVVLVTILTAYQTIQISHHNKIMADLPKEYVRLERYRCDQDRIASALTSIDSKVTILLRQGAIPGY